MLNVNDNVDKCFYPSARYLFIHPPTIETEHTLKRTAKFLKNSKNFSTWAVDILKIFIIPDSSHFPTTIVWITTKNKTLFLIRYSVQF